MEGGRIIWVNRGGSLPTIIGAGLTLRGYRRKLYCLDAL
jgi:hypothetical protein